MYVFSEFGDVIEEYKVCSIIAELYYFEVINSVYVLEDYINKDEDPYCIVHKESETIKTIYKKRISSRDLSSKFVVVKINEEKAVQYIKEYLTKWERDELYLPFDSILRREKQTEKVVQDIFKLIESVPCKNFLFSCPLDKDDFQIDHVAVILFLNKMHFLKIKENVLVHDFEKKEFMFRLELRDKFFDNFFYSKNTQKLYFDFDELVNARGRKKKLFYREPFILENENGVTYCLVKGKMPYELLQAAFDDVIVQGVDVNIISERSGIRSADLGKAFNNFRSSLRDKFDYSESEKLLSIENGQIFLDSKIFRKKQEK